MSLEEVMGSIGDSWGLECGTENWMAMKTPCRTLVTSPGVPLYCIKQSALENPLKTVVFLGMIAIICQIFAQSVTSFSFLSITTLSLHLL